MTGAASTTGAPSTAGRPLLVLGSVGTDHHPFDRLVGWLGEWCARQAPGAVRAVVQVGTSAPTPYAECVTTLGHHRFAALLSEAQVVVSHGGPGTIMGAREVGLRPICVPRVRSLGEHVDDHQLLFARRLAGEGLVSLAETREQLHALLDAAREDPGSVRCDAGPSSNSETLKRVEELISDVVAAGRRRTLFPVRAVRR